MTAYILYRMPFSYVIVGVLTYISICLIIERYLTLRRTRDDYESSHKEMGR